MLTVCPGCGQHINESSAVMMQGGLTYHQRCAPGGRPWAAAIQPPQRAYSPNRRTRVAAIVYAGFLGGVGAHKFYLGRPGWGVAYAMLCWTFLPVIAAFVEMIRYLMMSDEQFDLTYN